MVDRVESDGWVVFTNGTDTVKVYCETFKWKPVHKGRNKHYDGGINIGIPVEKKYIIAQAEGLWLDSVAKVEAYVSYIKTWLAANTLKIKFAYDGTNFLKLDGTYTIFPCRVKNDLGMIEKVAFADQQFYRVDKIIIEQTGTGS